jgi:hypothetical protein
MPSLKIITGSIIVVLIIFGVVSCVKDVDLSQTENISLKPKVQLDLLIFNVDQESFIDLDTGELKTVIQDTVRLEFLDDSYIQDDLSEVEFSYRYTNSFPRVFYNKISYLSENDVVQHSIDFYIGAGSKENPAVTERIDLIKSDRIGGIKRSIKMLVEIEALPGEDEFVGELEFESKGLFSFEF